MKDSTGPYKYSCRTCPIRQRCIEDKNLGPGMRRALESRFANRTDTFDTWQVLQQDCLLIREEDEESLGALQETSLLRRLRRARQSPPPPPSTPATPDVSQAKRKPIVSGPPPRITPSRVVPCSITVLSTQRLVQLPDHGEIVLGRFEHGFSNPPDVDLAFDDGEIPSVSRRHALVTGRGGRQWIEDMGSVNGTYLNGRRLSLGESVQLSPGDRLLLGRCRLLYAPTPEWARKPDLRVSHTAMLVVTHTSHQIELPDKSEAMVGRPDPNLGYTPDIDLSIAGEISIYVSRRHIRILDNQGQHLVQEAGSSGGTRLNGKQLQIGASPVPLRPGDQLWLAGCVVAYEWRLL